MAVFPEEVLSFVFCSPSIFYGMVWTVVKAAETCQAAVIMLPLRLMPFASDNIMYGTYVSAKPTFHTALAVYVEWPVGDESLREISSEDACL